MTSRYYFAPNKAKSVGNAQQQPTNSRYSSSSSSSSSSNSSGEDNMNMNNIQDTSASLDYDDGDDDLNGLPVQNTIPVGSNIQEFFSRPVSKTPIEPILEEEVSSSPTESIHSIKLRPNSSHHSSHHDSSHGEEEDVPLDPPIGSLIKERKVPIKVEPKVFLANERTFLTWMHSALWLFGASMTILTFSNGDPIKILYGAMIMPVALSFIVYAIFQYIRRARMIHRKAPGPYEDTVGPTILAMMLMLAIIGQFFVRFFYDPLY